MSQPIHVRVPTRIDFAGGWSEVPDFAGQEGGAVLNAAIDCCVDATLEWDQSGLTIQYRLDVPPDSHLGTSSATNLAWIELIHGLTEGNVGAVDRAEQAYAIETILGNKGGKQDQYAAALGGFNVLRFGAASLPALVEPVWLRADLLQDLAARCVLCWSGPSDDSGEHHAEVWKRFAGGDPDIRALLCRIRDSVEPAAHALRAGDWEAFGKTLTLNRELGRALSDATVTDKMDALFKAGQAAGALGSKGCGAGGGGYLLFLCGDDRAALEAALTKEGGKLRPFAFAPRRPDP